MIILFQFFERILSEHEALIGLDIVLVVNKDVLGHSDHLPHLVVYGLPFILHDFKKVGHQMHVDAVLQVLSPSGLELLKLGHFFANIGDIFDSLCKFCI